MRPARSGTYLSVRCVDPKSFELFDYAETTLTTGPHTRPRHPVRTRDHDTIAGLKYGQRPDQTLSEPVTGLAPLEVSDLLPSKEPPLHYVLKPNAVSRRSCAPT